MKPDFQKIARLKTYDRNIQAIACSIAVLGAPFTMGFSLFLGGFIHAVGTIYWAFAHRGMPVTKGRTILQVVNLSVLAVWILIPLIDGEYFFMMSVGMIIGGPILAILYFILTIREIEFYQALAVQAAIPESYLQEL